MMLLLLLLDATLRHPHVGLLNIIIIHYMAELSRVYGAEEESVGQKLVCTRSAEKRKKKHGERKEGGNPKRWMRWWMAVAVERI